MATQEDEVDPQYFWILPTYLELKPKARLPRGFYDVVPTGSEPFVTYLDWLTHMKKVTMHYEDESREQADTAEKAYKAFNVDNRISRAGRSMAKYLFYLKVFEALQHAGLDVRGGLPALYKTIDVIHNTAPLGECHLPTASIIISDIEKAKKYVNVGTHLSDLPTYPSTFEEAVETHAKLCILVADDMTIKEVENMIAETTD